MNTVNFRKFQVVFLANCDMVYAEIVDAPPAFPAYPETPASMQIQVKMGTGVAWVKSVFGQDVEIEVVHAQRSHLG